MGLKRMKRSSSPLKKGPAAQPRIVIRTKAREVEANQEGTPQRSATPGRIARQGCPKGCGSFRPELRSDTLTVASGYGAASRASFSSKNPRNAAWTSFQRAARRGAPVASLALLLVIAAAGAIVADGYHLPNFYEPTIEDGWKKLKVDFKFPELPEDKTWSDGYALSPFDKNIRPYKTLRKNDTAVLILKSVISKMISALKYTDPYNFAYDSPPWMLTEDSRAQAVKDAQAVLKEIGFHCLPYLWEGMKDELAFDNHPRMAGINEYRQAQLEENSALEALRNAMRAKSAEFKAHEEEIKKLVVEFWKQDSIMSSEAGKLNAEYGIKMRQMDVLIRELSAKDPDIKKLNDAYDKAKDDSKKALGKVPGDYFTVHQGGFRIADEFRSRLRDAVVAYGEKSKQFLELQARDRNPVVRKEAESLLDRVKQILKAEQAEKDKAAQAEKSGAAKTEQPAKTEEPVKRE